MRYLAFCLAILVLAIPTSEAANRPKELAATPRDQIQFTPSMNRAFDRSGKHVTSEIRPDGSTAVSLNGSFQNVTVARIGPDGSIETYCTTSEIDAKDWMARVGDRGDNVEVSGPDPDDAR